MAFRQFQKPSIVQPLPYRVIKASAQTSGCRAINVTTQDKDTYWSTSTGVNHEMVLQMNGKNLLGYVCMQNKGVSAIEFHVALQNKPHKGSFVQVQQSFTVPHNKMVKFNLGFVPCKYIKIRFLKGTPISVYSIQLQGLSTEKVPSHFGFQLASKLDYVPSSAIFNAKHGVRSDRKPQPTYPSSQENEVWRVPNDTNYVPSVELSENPSFKYKVASSSTERTLGGSLAWKLPPKYTFAY